MTLNFFFNDLLRDMMLQGTFEGLRYCCSTEYVPLTTTLR